MRMNGGRGVTYLLVQRFIGEQPQKKHGRTQQKWEKNRRTQIKNEKTHTEKEKDNGEGKSR